MGNCLGVHCGASRRKDGPNCGGNGGGQFNGIGTTGGTENCGGGMMAGPSLLLQKHLAVHELGQSGNLNENCNELFC